MIRNMLHNEEQITWAEQTEIELENFVKEFNEKVYPVFSRHGFDKNVAMFYWIASAQTNRLDNIIAKLEELNEAK